MGTQQLSVQFYRCTEGLEIPGHLRDQLRRAASSVPLNLAEGYGKASVKEQRRYFETAFASLREAQAILQLAGLEGEEPAQRADAVAASLYKLLRAVKRR
jgi:four helix bundle protein